MSRQIEDARRMFRRTLEQTGNNNLYGTVESVDESARTCRVKIGGVIHEGVLLHAAAGSDKGGMTPVPAIGSTVLLGRVGNSNRRFVAMYSEVEKLLLTIGEGLQLAVDAGGMRLTTGEQVVCSVTEDGAGIEAGQSVLGADTDGITLKKGGNGLKQTLLELCDAIKTITVPTGTGPSGTPVNRAVFDRIKQGLNDYLK